MDDQSFTTTFQVPASPNEILECYDACSPAWEFSIAQSLRNLITTGVGAPNDNEKEAV
jgi:hypothetical protein